MEEPEEGGRSEGKGGGEDGGRPRVRGEEKRGRRRNFLVVAPSSQGAYAKVTGSHCPLSSCSSCKSGACGKQVQSFTAALEATPGFVCFIAENLYDCSGDVTSDKHPEEQFC